MYDYPPQEKGHLLLIDIALTRISKENHNDQL
jgi:hypothetical protein